MVQTVGPSLRSTLVFTLALAVIFSCARKPDWPDPTDPDENFAVQVADPDHSSVSVDPASNVLADGVAVATITVTVRDSTDHPIKNQALLIEVNGSGNTLSAATMSSDENGAASVSLTSTVDEEKTIMVTVDPGIHAVVLSSQPKVVFVAKEDVIGDPSSPASGSESKLTASPKSGVLKRVATQRADHMDRSTVTLVVRNAAGQRIAGRDVELAFVRPASAITDVRLDDVQGSAPVVTKKTDASGVVSASLESFNDGIHKIIATIKPTASEGNVVMETTLGFGAIFGAVFSQHRFMQSGLSVQSMSVGNLDGNSGLEVVLGLEDLDSSRAPVSSVEIYQLGADGSFATTPALLDSFLSPKKGRTDPSDLSQPMALAIGDLGADGDMDLILATSDTEILSNPGENNDLLCAFRNGGGIDFPAVPDSMMELESGGADSFEPNGIAAAQLDGNTGIDFLITFSNHSGVWMVPTTAAGGFNTPVPLLGSAYSAVAVGDINGDSRVDALLYDGSFGGGLDEYLNQGSAPIFKSVRDRSINVGRIEALALADMNGDGKLDLVTGGSNIVIYYGLGDGQFTSAVQTASASADSSKLSVLDVNGDGRADLVAGNGDTVNVLINSPGL